MSTSQELEVVRSARRVKAAAKVVSLRGGESVNAGFEGMHLMLDGMRVYLASKLGYPKVRLVPREGGFALFLDISHGPRVWLIAEHSKRVRIFARVETAFVVCRQLGADRFTVFCDDPDAVRKTMEAVKGSD